MPSLTPKQIGGHTYYYARYCQRVDGKPKIVRQVYLGKIDDLVAAAELSRQPPQPLETEVAAFADIAALFDIAQRLDLLPLLDSILPPKRHQGLSVGQYVLLAAINRAVSPTSKLQFADWYRQTALTRLLPADPAALSSQNFWNHMDLVTAEHVLECEKQITQHLIQRFQLDLRALVYDGTNFFTYINTRTPAELPQRGHNKQKRGDLRQVSLGLLVSTDFHIPLFHKVYAGNVGRSDGQVFKHSFADVSKDPGFFGKITGPAYAARAIQLELRINTNTRICCTPRPGAREEPGIFESAPLREEPPVLHTGLANPLLERLYLAFGIPGGEVRVA